ncbi:DUF4221 family protein [Flavobacterium sp.]|jgi:hypothetical protein|uniref:DUF4221 family protein n=2 Tax=Flavobacterium sp. TaxID=239 RepID=UPI0037BFE02B
MKKIFFILILIFNYSCEKELKKLNIKEEVAFGKPEGLSLYGNLNSFNNKIYCTSFDIKHNKNKIYRLKENGGFEELVFQNFSKPFHGYQFISDNELILNNGIIDSIYIVNTEKGVIHQDKLFFKDRKNVINQIFSTSLNPIYKIKDEIYFSPFFFNYDKNQLKKISILYAYNIKSKKFRSLNIKIPNSYLESDFFSPNICHTYDGENIVFSPDNSHEIWIYNIIKNNFISKNIKSDNFREFRPFSNDPNKKMNESLYEDCFYSRYHNVYFDKKKKLYYRIFVPGQDIEKNDKRLRKLVSNPKSISVIVFNKNFEKISELLLDNYKFNIVAFTNDNGFYISVDNEFSSNKNVNLPNLLKFRRLGF